MPSYDLLCFSHLRWDWVYQRPQHLLTRAARKRRVFFFEEPVFGASSPHLLIHAAAQNVVTLRPQLPDHLDAEELVRVQRALVDEFVAGHRLRVGTIWYYTPMALPFTRHLQAGLRVYDCMDELSAFAGAPAALRLLERQLLHHCELVFTGGWSLYEAKASLHSSCHAMPSSVDVAHFAKARTVTSVAGSYDEIATPRIGYCGVIDERIDLALLADVAHARPNWQFVMVGPVTKIDPSVLPRHPNIHYLGARPYDALPAEMAAWDAAWMPFAINDATRYISPTKTPEYLAAGLPVVSTPVRDVVRTWGADGLVHVGATADECVDALSKCLGAEDPRWRAAVDKALSQLSWDATWQRMEEIMSRSAAAAA